jgi:anti-anti-sigma factor
MQITKLQRGDVVEVRISGRLDGYWAEHLSTGLADVVREGGHQIRVNLSEVSFLSSAGIRVLVQCFKQLRAIDGALAVCHPSQHVSEVLKLAGLHDLLVSADDAAPAVISAAPSAARRLERETVTLDVFSLQADGQMTCRPIGDPSRLDVCGYTADDLRSQAADFPRASLAVGLGALGKDFEDCRQRFGEFLWIAGAAAYLPTDGTNVPDYLISGGTGLPDLKVLYGLTCEGPWRYLARFQAVRKDAPVALSALMDACLEIAGTDMAAIAMVAEASGLVGAALKQSPVAAVSGTAPFGFPEVQQWLSFTPERAYPKTVVLGAGVSARTDGGPIAPLLRPFGTSGIPAGHVHAAVFSYRPMRKGYVDLSEIVRGLFETESPQTLLHLLHDDRERIGAGQSEFIQGACWIGPIGAVQGASRP